VDPVLTIRLIPGSSEKAIESRPPPQQLFANRTLTLIAGSDKGKK